MRKEYDWTKAWKRKQDNKIVTIISRSYGASTPLVKFMGEDGFACEMEDEKFYKEFDPIHINYQDIKDNIAEFCNLSYDFRQFGDVVKKRLDPDYFEIGKLVYITSFSSFFTEKDCYYNRSGPEFPYVIKDIKIRENPYSTDLPFLEVMIARMGKHSSDEVDYTFPIYPSRPDPNDAYCHLSRYDKPY